MSEKISFASLDFILLLCDTHQKELELSALPNNPLYICKEDNCKTKLPTYVYEKIHADILKRFNDGTAVIGENWIFRCMGKTYSCKVIALASGKQAKISVKCI